MNTYKIYYIENVINKKRYVGKTSKSLDKRFKTHCKNAKKNINRRLYDSMNHHGYDKFKIHLLEEVSDNNTANIKEREYISKFNSRDKNFGYNMTNGGDGGNTGKYHYGKSAYNWWIEKYGKSVADKMKHETYLKISNSLKGRKNVVKKETCDKISAILKQKYKTGELKSTLKPKFGEQHSGWVDIDLDKIKEMMYDGKSLRYISEIVGHSEFLIRDRIKREFNRTFEEIKKTIRLNNKSEQEIYEFIKNNLDNCYLKTIKQIVNELGVKEHICRKIFKEKLGLTFEEYRVSIGVPLNNYGRKINSFKISDIENEFLNGNFNLKNIAKKIGVSTDVIQNKIEKELNINFSQFKKKFYERIRIN